jgi:hypothetical protein
MTGESSPSARPDLRFLTAREHAIVTAAADHMIPAVEGHPGAVALGAADYVDATLAAFSFDPPRIWAGGPFSGRAGGTGAFAEFSELSVLEDLAWRTRIEGSQGDPRREFNGPVRGWQEQYRAGLAALGDDFDTVDADERQRRLDADPAFRTLLYEHLCEGSYGAPEYGGNRDTAAWVAIQFPGDVQPRGWTDEEVSQP